MATARITEPDDPHLGLAPDSDASEASLSESESDSDSVLSDDSVLPDYKLAKANWGTASTLYEACAHNEPQTLQKVLDRGVTKEEVMEVDGNGWNGLMVACYKGFLEIVYGLHHCPYLDINHQDKDGNTALMMAAQAGHITTVMYMLNYFAGMETEIRDSRGFTALIKAAMQGRDDIVAALIMAGADVNAVDSTRGKCARDWAFKTGRFETLYRLRRLNKRPRADQFCVSYIPEWPGLVEMMAKDTANKSAGAKITQRIKSTFGFNFPRDPQDNGVLDHMVRMTTGIYSPFVATACRPLCPSSPPEVGKRRMAVSELVRKHTEKKLEASSVGHSNGPICNGPNGSIIPSLHSCESIGITCCPDTERRGSILSLTKVGSFLPRNMARRNSVIPTGCLPQLKVIKSGEPTPKKEKKRKIHKGFLEPPKWKYKEIKEEKKREKKKAEKEKIEIEKAKGKNKK